jgi:hypothetical protein
LNLPRRDDQGWPGIEAPEQIPARRLSWEGREPQPSQSERKIRRSSLRRLIRGEENNIGLDIEKRGSVSAEVFSGLQRDIGHCM